MCCGELEENMINVCLHVINITTECLMCNNRHAARINILYTPFTHTGQRCSGRQWSVENCEQRVEQIS